MTNVAIGQWLLTGNQRLHLYAFSRFNRLFHIVRWFRITAHMESYLYTNTGGIRLVMSTTYCDIFSLTAIAFQLRLCGSHLIWVALLVNYVVCYVCEEINLLYSNKCYSKRNLFLTIICIVPFDWFAMQDVPVHHWHGLDGQHADVRRLPACLSAIFPGAERRPLYLDTSVLSGSFMAGWGKCVKY